MKGHQMIPGPRHQIIFYIHPQYQKVSSTTFLNKKMQSETLESALILIVM